MTANLRLLTQVAYRRLTGWFVGYKPFIMSHLVTGHCNFTCKSCLWKDNESADLTLPEMENLYRQAKKEGFVATYIWGGEPLIRKDIAAILRTAREQGMITFMNTNAWYIEQKITEIHHYLDAVIVSLDHPEKKGHDAIRGVKGAYDRVIAAVKMLRKEYPRIRVFINTLALEDNEKDILEILDIWRELGVHGYVNFIETDLLEAGGFRDRKKEIDVREARRRQIAESLIAAKRRGAPLLNTMEYFEKFREGKKSYSCHFPKMFLEIYPDGSVVDCVNVDRPVANVRTTPLREVLKHPRIQGMVADGEKWCHVHNNADRIDASLSWDFDIEAVGNLLRFL